METREAQLEDWIEDLREFGPAIVESACKEWRRLPGGRRPTPGDIRALCIREERPVERVAIEGSLDRDAWAHSLGWASYRDRQDAIARNAEQEAENLRWQAENASELAAVRVRGFKSAAAALGVTARAVMESEAGRTLRESMKKD